jgi:hypothetical protein
VDVVVADAGAGWPVIAAIVEAAFAEPACFVDFFFPFFFSYSQISTAPHLLSVQGLTSCQPQTGLKLSKNPTSSNKFGYNHNPGGTANIVIANRISLNIAMAKNNPIRPSMPILRYQTPSLIFIGQRGNMTIAKTTASAPAAYSFCLI